jgi:hypothetical protein
MWKIEPLEAAAPSHPEWTGGLWPAYMRNHNLTSFYHPTFSTPLHILYRDIYRRRYGI